MEITRTVMDSDRLASVMDIPEDYRHQDVEVVVFSRVSGENAAVAEESLSPEDKLMGVFKEYANPALRKLEKKAWERAAAEKYDLESIRMNERQFRMFVAVKLYEDGRLNSGQAAEMVGITRREFLEQMGDYGVSIYDQTIDEVLADMNNA